MKTFGLVVLFVVVAALLSVFSQLLYSQYGLLPTGFVLFAIGICFMLAENFLANIAEHDAAIACCLGALMLCGNMTVILYQWMFSSI